jgi:single-strand DNA-binding protein
MTDQLTLTGLIATTPRHIVTTEGLAITSFRLASQQRRFDKNSGVWADADTNWYTITAFRELAINSAQSLNKGDRVVTVGRLRVKDWSNDDRSGTSVEVEAESLGHDLHWGTSEYHKVARTDSPEESDPAESDPAETDSKEATVEEEEL